MTYPGILSAAALLLFAAVSCERPFDPGIDSLPPQLVVVSNFSDQKAIQVQVSLSRPVTDNSGQAQFVNDATVEIFRDDTTLLEILDFVPGRGKLPPYYITRALIPEANVLYTIKVDAPGFETVMAQSKIPRRIQIRDFEISNVKTENVPGGSQVKYSFDVFLSFEDPGEETNFYHLNFYQQVFDYTRHEGDTIILGSTLQPIEFSSYNDNNFLIAYFSGGVLFEDASFNGRLITNTFGLQMRIDQTNELLGKMFVELRTVSEEYFLYHNSLSRQQNSPNHPFGDPVTIYDNIENGLGIFAGYTLSIDSLRIIN
jgi:hypothetical protein